MYSSKSFYKELYHYEGTKHTVVLNEITGTLGLKKCLKYFDVKVFECLKMNMNPYIPRVYDYWMEDDKLIVIEELVQGISLDEYLEKNNISRKKRYDILYDVLDALMFLHSQKNPIIHRDLKMANIMVTNDGNIKVVDYDAAKIYKPNQHKDTTLIGTEGVAAPEQYGFAQSDVRSDVYAVGVLIKELLPRDKGALFVANKATKIDPDDRYRNIKTLKNDLVHSPFSLWPIPGFRTLNPGKMVIAIIVYALQIFMVWGFKIELLSVSFLNEFLPQFFLWAVFICELDLLFDWFHLFIRFPFMQTKNKLLKVFVVISYSLLQVFFWFILILASIYMLLFLPGITKFGM